MFVEFNSESKSQTVSSTVRDSVTLLKKTLEQQMKMKLYQ